MAKQSLTDPIVLVALLTLFSKRWHMSTVAFRNSTDLRDYHRGTSPGRLEHGPRCLRAGGRSEEIYLRQGVDKLPLLQRGTDYQNIPDLFRYREQNSHFLFSLGKQW